jgi:RNA polymerase sigma-B factor
VPKTATTNRTTKASSDQVERRHRAYFAERRPEDRDWLVEQYQGLARALAIKSAGPRDEVDDLVQVAFLGLIRALERFDPNRGFAFSTFAWATISGELKRHHRDHSWDVRVPRSVQESYLRVAAASEALLTELQRPPTIAELAERCGDDETLVIQALEARHARSVRSLDVPVGPEGTASIDVPITDAMPELIDDRDLIQNLLGRLPERDRTIVQRRFFDRWTQAEIAENVGCSQMHVSRLLSHSLARLRQMAELELSGVSRGPRSADAAS